MNVLMTTAWMVLGLAVLAAPATAETIALTGGTLHPVSGPPVENGTLVMQDGRITAVGAGVTVPEGARVIEVRGRHVYPGMIAAHTTLGLVEIRSVRGTRDMNETGEINPNARAMVALNADSEMIPVARVNGVLTVLSATQGGVISGTSAVWNLDGWNWEEMTVDAAAGVHIRWPNMTTAQGGWNRKSPEEQNKEREEKIQKLRDAFNDAQAYRKARGVADEGGPAMDHDVRWDAMMPLLAGEIPAFVHADEYQQIEAALDFAEEQDIRMIIVGGRDAWRLADRLVAESVPVILELTDNLPRRSWEPYDATYSEANKLYEAGVEFCISYGAGAYEYYNIRNLPYVAGMSAAFGLPKDEALKAVTLYPARILGLEDELGSLEVGKLGNVFVTDGDPLEILTNVEHVFIAGNEVPLTSRHTALYERYRQRPRTDDRESSLVPAASGD